MRTTTYTRRFNQEPEVLTSFLSNLGNDPKWRQEITRADLVSGSPGEPGSRFLESVTWEGLHAEATLTVTELVVGSHLVVRAQDPGYESMYDYRFSAVDGGTELVLTMSMETMGPLQLIEPFMWALVTRWVERDLDALDVSVLAANNGEEPGMPAALS